MVSVTDTKSNLYGEGKDKVFHQPIKVPCLVERNQSAQISDDFGQIHFFVTSDESIFPFI